MRPWHECPLAHLRDIDGVLTDIDDTLTTDGKITPDALAALHDLKSAGLAVIAVTGRPIAWSEAFARDWPLDAIVAENGAVAWIKPRPCRLDHDFGSLPAHSLGLLLSKKYLLDAASRAKNFAKLQNCLHDIEQRIPGAKRATDSDGRETDIAIDHSECHHLSPKSIDAVCDLMRQHGLRATVSSIHINGWLGEHDKWVGACWMVRELLGRELSQERNRWLYAGDSSNDAVMFEALAHSVGVANIARFVGQLRHLPAWVTPGERGAGFAQVAARLLRSKIAV